MNTGSQIGAGKKYTSMIGVAAVGIFIVVVYGFIKGRILPLTDDGLLMFKTMLISIILEAVPFLLLGILVSAVIQVYVPNAWIEKIIPKNPIAGVLVASLLGIVFPVCECGLIPVVRRLIAKGMPVYAAITFIIAGPIVNPVVYAATYAAFRNRPDIVWSRMGLAVAASALVGLVIWKVVKYNPLKRNAQSAPACSFGEHKEETASRKRYGKGKKLADSMSHAAGEFFEMGKYLMIGSLLTAFMQAFISRADLLAIGQGEASSHLFMMGFAYVLSLCSTSDAFVASSFLGTFSAGSIVTFLVFGPMLDLKGTLMLLSAFKVRFVFFLSVVIAFVVLAGALLTERLFL